MSTPRTSFIYKYILVSQRTAANQIFALGSFRLYNIYESLLAALFWKYCAYSAASLATFSSVSAAAFLSLSTALFFYSRKSGESHPTFLHTPRERKRERERHFKGFSETTKLKCCSYTRSLCYTSPRGGGIAKSRRIQKSARGNAAEHGN